MSVNNELETGDDCRLFQTIDLALNLYTWVLIASAIFSWLYAFNVINSSNQFVNSVGMFLYNVDRTGAAADPPRAAESRRHRHFADHPAADHLLHFARSMWITICTRWSLEPTLDGVRRSHPL